MRKAGFIFLALAVAGFAGNAGAQVVVSGDISVDTTWGPGLADTATTKPCPVILDGPVTVSDGGASFADGTNVKTQLTILPDCIVRGQPRTGPDPAFDAPGSLVITQTGRLNAVGNPDSPIIFTTATTDNNDDNQPDFSGGFLEPWDPGDVFYDDDPANSPMAPLDAAGIPNVQLWGGLVMLGLAPINTADTAKCGTGQEGLCQVEGLAIPGVVSLRNAIYGGNEVHDSCGEVNYISVRHGGDEIGTANEINGVTIGGCGDATEFGFVEVYANFDDGVEWFGGTANAHHLAITLAGDDSLDTDQGATGITQFSFIVQPWFGQVGGGNFGSSSGDKMGEWDGDDCASSAGCIDRPLQDHWHWNVTGIGSAQEAGADFTPAAADDDGVDDNRGIDMRNGFGGALVNSVIVNTTNVGLEVRDGDGPASPDPRSTTERLARCEVQVFATSFRNAPVTSADAQAALACGDNDARTGAAGVNVVGGLFQGLAQSDASFDPTGDASNKLSAGLKTPGNGPINPETTGFSGVVGGLVPVEGAQLDTGATFRGAFDSSLNTLWTDQWTVLSIAGLLEN